jgi:hypothetical protein
MGKEVRCEWCSFSNAPPPLAGGGSAGAAYGFPVSAAGLAARSYNAGKDGAAFGVANNPTLTLRLQRRVAVVQLPCPPCPG